MAGVVLPNFCNLGIMLRILFIVDGMSVVAAMLKAPTYDGMWRELMNLSALVQPVLLLSLLFLCLGRGVLSRLPYHFGVAAVLLLELVLSTLVHYLQREGLDPTRGMSSAQEQMMIGKVTEYLGGTANAYQIRTYLASLRHTGLPADVSKYKASTT